MKLFEKAGLTWDLWNQTHWNRVQASASSESSVSDSDTEPQWREVVSLCLELAHRVEAGVVEDGWCPSMMTDGSKHYVKGFGPCDIDLKGE